MTTAREIVEAGAVAILQCQHWPQPSIPAPMQEQPEMYRQRMRVEARAAAIALLKAASEPTEGMEKAIAHLSALRRAEARILYKMLTEALVRELEEMTP